MHCSKQCEDVAKAEFGFKVENTVPKCPKSMDVGYAFGADALDVKGLAKHFKEKAAGISSDPAKSPSTTRSPQKSPTPSASLT
jgi:hypothetical protein